MSTPEETYARLKQAVDDAEARADEAAALHAASEWFETFPQHAAPAHRLSEVHRRAGDLRAALDVAQRALSHHPNDAAMLKRASKICAALHDMESAIEYRLACAEIPEERRDSLIYVAKFRLALADAAGAKQALDDAVAAGEPRERHRLIDAHVAYYQRDRAAGLALVEADEAENGVSSTSESLRKKLNRLAPDRARGASSAIRIRSAATAELKAFAEAANVPVGDATPAATRLITEAGDILMERVHGSRALLIAFGGLSTMFGGSAEDMGFLVRNARINALFVSDPQRLLMLGGFASVGEYWQTIGWLKDLQYAWSIERFYCLGLSGGGYPALRYGLDLGARRILTFAAPTEISPTITQVDGRATAIANRILTRRPHMCVNLRDEIAKRGADAPEIINYYGADMPEDAYHARNIEGLPTVSSRPVEGLAAHGVIGWLKQTGAFRGILREFLREEAPPEENTPADSEQTAEAEPLQAVWKAS